MKRTVYLETTVVSYLAAWPSRDIIRAAHQNITREWWTSQRDKFELYVSQFVIDEVQGGDPVAASERLLALKDATVLISPTAIYSIAKRIMETAKLPAKAGTDALHVAVAAYHRVDYLLTWNCRHINNVDTKDRFAEACRLEGLLCPRICTPEELLGESAYED
jgi:hypothetical protein